MTPLALTILGALILPSVALWAASRKQRSLRFLAFTLFAFSLALLWFAAYQLDQISGASTSWLFCVSFILAGAAISVAISVRCPSRIIPGLGAFFLIAVLLLHFLDLTPMKPYGRFKAGIRNGMTPAGINKMLDRYLPADTRLDILSFQQAVPPAPPVGNYYAFLTPRIGNAALSLEFRDGRLVGYDPPIWDFSFIRLHDRLVLILGPFLAICLCLKEWRRTIRGPREMSAGLDARPVLESLRDVRCDYFAAHHASQRELSWRRRLLASARHALGQMAYFKSHTPN